MNKFLKQNWFVVVIAVFLVGIFCFYIYDTNKDNLPSKSVGGKDVVFSIDDKNYTADDLYEELNGKYGQQQLLMVFQRAVLDANVKNSIVRDATEYYVSAYKSSLKMQYGYSDSEIDQLYASYGYRDLEDFIRCSLKTNVLCDEYLSQHIDEYATTEFMEKQQPRIVSYCLIKVNDLNSLTEEESKKLKEAQDAWNSGEFTAETFAEFCKKYSQDSTAQQGGLLGYMDADSSLQEDFKKAALALKEGEVTEQWVAGSGQNSAGKYAGYWLIKCDTTSVEKLKEDSSFFAAILEANTGLAEKIVWSYAEAAGIKFANQETEEYIRKALGVLESEAK